MLVVFTVKCRVQPHDRGEVFDEPLDEWLAEAGGGEVVGGGTMMAANGEIEYCDIEVDLASENQFAGVVEFLTGLGAAKGSYYVTEDSNETHEFGTCEGMGLYLNGTELDDSVYKTCSAQEVYDAVSAILEGHGMIMSHWQGPTETALYIYGPSFTTMSEKIAEFVKSHPLCQKSRVEQIA